MTLSKYLVLNSKDDDLLELSLEQIKVLHRKMTRDWMSENPDFVKSMEEHYSFVTGNDFKENIEEIYDGYSDHYSEKLYVYASRIKDVKSQLHEIKAAESDLNKIREAVKKKSVLGFIGHLGGMEFIPTYFGELGIPVTVMLRFKSEQAKRMAQEQMSRYPNLDMNLIDVGGDLYRNFRSFLKEKRLLITVFDGFDNWQINQKSEEVEWLGHQLKLDSTPNRLHSLTGKQEVFYLSMIRNGSDYHLNVDEISPNTEEGIPVQIFRKWKESVLANPNQWYIWDETDELFD